MTMVAELDQSALELECGDDSNKHYRSFDEGDKAEDESLPALSCLRRGKPQGVDATSFLPKDTASPPELQQSRLGRYCLLPPLVVLLAFGSMSLVAIMYLAQVGSSGAIESLQIEGAMKQLELEKQALQRRALLVEQEHQDLVKLLLDPKAKDRLSSIVERSHAFDSMQQAMASESSPETTKSVQKCLGQIIHEMKILSILDVPCGTTSWQSRIPGIHNVAYVGADLNPKKLEASKSRPENQGKNMSFLLFDAVHFPLRRKFDLVLFRGIVEQQRIQDSLSAVLNFKKSGSRFFASSYWPASPAEVNRAAYNLDHAGWYEANLEEAPFGFPEPIFSCENADVGSTYRGRSRLGIWRLEDIPVDSEAVKMADPERHSARGPLSRHQPLPHQIHMLGASPISNSVLNSGHVAQPLSLDSLIRFFGESLEEGKLSRPEVRSRNDITLHPIKVIRHQMPFDGILSDWLETTGLGTESETLSGDFAQGPGGFARGMSLPMLFHRGR